MKVQLTLILALSNVAFWIWLGTSVLDKYGPQSEIQHIVLIGFGFAVWLALRVNRNEQRQLKAEQASDGNAEKPPGVERKP